MAGRGSVKLSIYSTFKDDGTKKAERALAQFAKKYGQVEKATGRVKLNAISKQLAEQSIMWDRVSQKCYKFAGRLDKAAKKFAPFSAAAAAALGGSVKLAADFEDAMGKVATIMDKSQVSVEDMSDALLDLSTETGISANELAEAAYQAQSASVSTKNAAMFTGEAAKLARAGFTETATAVDTLTTILNAYKLSEEETASIADKLVQTQNKGKTTVDELSQSIGQAIPTAAAYNVNLDNLLTSYVVLTKQGINTANATTYINSMMTELAKGGSKVSDVLKKETGKTFSDLMADGKSLGDVLGILYQSVDGDSTAFANMWGNVRAGKGALALAQAGVEGFNSELAGMADSAGTVDAALEDLETPAYKAQKALNALKNTGILLGQEVIAEVAPALEKMVQAAQKMFEKFKALPQSTKQSIVKMLAMTAALAPLLKLFASGFRLVGSFASGMAKLSANLAKFAAKGGAAAKFAGSFGKLLSGPVVLGIMAAVAAIALIVKAFSDWKKKQENLKKATDGLVDATRAISPSLDDEAAAMSKLEGATGDAALSVDELMEKQAQLAETIAERNHEAEVEIAQLEAAKQVINEYAGATELSEREQGKLQAAIALVNEECGTEYEVVDAANGVIKDQEGNLLDTTDAIEKYIDKKKEQLRLEALQENYKDLYKQQFEDQQALTKAQEAYNDALKEQKEHQNESSYTTKAYSDKVAEAERNLHAAEDALDATTKSLENTEEQMGKATDAAKEMGESGKKAAESYGEGIDEGASSAVSAAENMGDDVKAELDSVDSEGSGNLFSTLFGVGIQNNSASAIGKAALMASDSRKRLGVDTSGKGKSFAFGFGSGISNNSGGAVSAASTMANNAKDGLNADSYSKGCDFGKGYINGINYYVADAYTAGWALAHAASQGTKDGQDSGSPSKVTEKLGKWFGEGYEIGIDAETRNVVSAARGMANAALGQFDQRPTYQGGYGSVTNIYIDGAKINDDPAVRGIVLNLMGELRRLSYA